MTLKPGGFWTRRWLVTYAGISILVLATLHVVREYHHASFITDHHLPLPYTTAGSTYHDPCASLGGLEDVFIIIRTGSNEVHKKLPSLLNTTLPCYRHYGIWSDREEEFAGQRIGNALDELDSGLVSQHPDFEYYRRLQEHGKGAGFTSEEIEGWKDAPNTGFGRDVPGWKLDKWKFLPTANKAYRQSPTSKWYIFTELDTYIFWNSLLTWLSHLDASQPYYIGRQMNMGSDRFAYGGAGIIISNPAMRLLVERSENDTRAYNELTLSQWAGDYVLSKVMGDAGVELSWAWPTLEGDMPSTLDFRANSRAGYPLWCYYATTYHHMAPENIHSYFAFDQDWDSKRNASHPQFPRHSDLFRKFVLPHLSHRIDEWDNLSTDVRTGDPTTFEECRAFCVDRAECLQFSFLEATGLDNSNICKTLDTIKLGQKRVPRPESEVEGLSAEEKEKNRNISSGWIVDRVEGFMRDLDGRCSGQDWVAV
ncbi:hypothetical protein F5Y17DRAFT_110807 [Xylariaceae sp. FL0594]|nr:hypothetical protein F5Y17DRAFT_110807 [Xylariaceae sp. FL0594]